MQSGEKLMCDQGQIVELQVSAHTVYRAGEAAKLSGFKVAYLPSVVQGLGSLESEDGIDVSWKLVFLCFLCVYCRIMKNAE